jgi:hypothetical protein
MKIIQHLLSNSDMLEAISEATYSTDSVFEESCDHTFMLLQTGEDAPISDIAAL